MRKPGSFLIMAVVLTLALSMISGGSAAAGVSPEIISGLVTGDRGAPLVGAQVEIFRYRVGLVGRAITDKAGLFTLPLSSSAERLYWIRVWAEGYEMVEQVWLSGTAGGPLTFSLQARFGSMQGQVEDPDAAGVANAQVTLLRTGVGAVAQALTDSNGGFRFERIPAGDGYSIMVTDAGWLPVTSPIGPIPAGGEVTTRSVIRPFAGEISGRVVDSTTGTPLAGARVAVERSDLGVVVVLSSSATGSFNTTIPAVDGVSYRLHVSLTGRVPHQTDWLKPDHYGRIRLDGTTRIELSRLSGAIAGYVRDQDGDPAVGVPVWLEQEGTGILTTAETGENGEFSWAEQQAGPKRYRVKVVPKQIPGNSTHTWPAATGTDWFDLNPGQTANLNLVVVDGRLVDYQDGTIRGAVMGADGSPLTGATVDLIRIGDGVAATTTTAEDGTYHFDAVAANRPLRVTPMVGPGNGYIIRASLEGYADNASTVVDVYHAREVLADLTLYPTTGKITIHVVDQDGVPLLGAEVRLHSSTAVSALTARTGGDGTAHLIAPASPAYWLEVSAAGQFAAAVTPVTLERTDDTVLSIQLRRQLGCITGLVTDRAGGPVSAGTRVTALTPDGAAASATTDAGGRYLLSDLRVGVPLVVTAGEGFASSLPQLVTVEPSESPRTDLQVWAADGAVEGRLLDGGGLPVPGIEVQLWRSGYGKVAATTTDLNGSYHFEQVAADSARSYAVRIQVSGHGYRMPQFRSPPPLFTVQAGETVHLFLTLTTW